MIRRLWVAPPAEQTYEDLILLDNQPEGGGEMSCQLAIHALDWAALGSPEFVDVQVLVPDRLGPG